MKYYVVLDTNVVVSALFNISSVPGIILQEALAGRVIPLLHEDILDEYNDVLHRPKFKFDRRDIEIALTGLIKRGIFLDAATIEDYVPDPDDAIFYEGGYGSKRNYRRLSCNRQHQAFPGQALCGDAKRDAGNSERK